MTRRRRDPIESAIESALQPGHFISWDQERAFVAGLEAVGSDIAALADNDPVLAARLYEAFIAACYLKSDEMGIYMTKVTPTDCGRTCF